MEPTNRSQYKTEKFRDALDDFLDRPIAYNPAFKRITGSTVAGVFLSQAWYWSKRHNDDDGWFYKSGIEWEEETGLTRSEQETARRHCKRIGVVEEKLTGVPATLHYRVNKSKVYELLNIQFAGFPQTEFAETPQSSLQDNSKPDRDILPNYNKESEIPPEIPTRTPLAGAGIDWAIGHNQPIQDMDEPTKFRFAAMDAANLIAMGKPVRYQYAMNFMIASDMVPTQKQIKAWRKTIDEWLSIQPTPPTPQDVTVRIAEHRRKDLSFSGPHSFTYLFQQKGSGKNGNHNETGNQAGTETGSGQSDLDSYSPADLAAADRINARAAKMRTMRG